MELSRKLYRHRCLVLNWNFACPQVLSALDILQPPHIDYFEEMYPLPLWSDCDVWSTEVSRSEVLNPKARILLLKGF